MARLRRDREVSDSMRILIRDMALYTIANGVTIYVTDVQNFTEETSRHV